jgi:hypothetical protein
VAKDERLHVASQFMAIFLFVFAVHRLRIVTENL